MADESEESELVAASVASDPFQSHNTGIRKKVDEEKKSPDDEEAMESGTPQDDFDESPDPDGKKDNKASLMWKSRGYTYEFNYSPVKHSAWIMLTLRAVERGMNFGFMFINPYFLTGVYNPTWSPGFSSAKASAFQSGTMALNNTLPFIIALFADMGLGDYWAILIILLVFFLPGILIIFLCAWPYLLGDTFNVPLLRIGMQLLYTIGSGGIDTICDVFGAKQFHPVHHCEKLDKYFVWASVMVGIGGMTATLVYSMIANFKVTPAFGAMFILLLAATVLFIYGTKRYIIRKVDWRANTLTLRAIIASLFCWKKDNSTDRVVACAPGFDKLKVSNGGWIKDDLVTAAFRLLLIVPVQGFFIPVNLGVQQFVMLMLPMSLSMNHPKMWSGTNMVFANSSHIALFGILANKYFYPHLESRNIHLSTCRRIAIGSFFWVVSYLTMVGVDHRIRRVYEETGEQISIGWQYFPYAIAGLAYVFTFPPLDSITYRVAPSEWKVFGNAINKFMQAGISNFIARVLYIRTADWFTPDNGGNNINGIENYTAARSYKFMFVCAGFTAFQSIVCMLPWVDRLYQKIEEYVQAKEDEEEMSRRMGN